MDKKYRQRFNKDYRKEAHKFLQHQLDQTFKQSLAFRVSESPIFLPSYFRDELLEASESIVDQILQLPNEQLDSAIPPHIKVYPSSAPPTLMCIDFGICHDQDGHIIPALIEIQSCASLHYYQYELAQLYKEIYQLPSNLTCYFSGLTDEQYLDRMSKLILDGHQPKEVALVDFRPHLQKTRIDFAATQKHLDIPVVCLTDLRHDDQDFLYYKYRGGLKKIKRIFNRFVFDEMERLDSLSFEVDLSKNLHVDWVVHPNWFFKISKHTMPSLKHRFVPATYFADEFPSSESLEDYVLKPLFSYSGQGVLLNPKKSDLKRLTHPKEFILQKRFPFAPVFKDIRGDYSKAEIRLIYTWLPGESRPKPTINLVRMTKSEMSNVDHNQANLIWTGGSIAFFEK